MKKFLLTLPLLFSALISMACEPGGTLLGDNLELGLRLAIVFGILCCALALIDFGQLRYRFLSLLYLVLIPLHPYWWMPVYSGDCGMMMKEWSVYSTIAIGGYLLFRLYRRFVNSKAAV